MTREEQRDNTIDCTTLQKHEQVQTLWQSKRQRLCGVKLVGTG